MTKIQATKLTLSNHLTIERADRLATIRKVGWGQVVKESWHYNCWHALTDTGVMLVVDENRTHCVTAYFIDQREANKLYNGHVPTNIQKRISRNVNEGLVNLYRNRKGY